MLSLSLKKTWVTPHKGQRPLPPTQHPHFSSWLQCQVCSFPRWFWLNWLTKVRAGFSGHIFHLVSFCLKQTGFSDLPQELSDSPVSWLSCSFVLPSSIRRWRPIKKVQMTEGPGQRWRWWSRGSWSCKPPQWPLSRWWRRQPRRGWYNGSRRAQHLLSQPSAESHWPGGLWWPQLHSWGFSPLSLAWEIWGLPGSLLRALQSFLQSCFLSVFAD